MILHSGEFNITKLKEEREIKGLLMKLLDKGKCYLNNNEKC